MLHSTLNADERTRREPVCIGVAISLILLAILSCVFLFSEASSGQHMALRPVRLPATLPSPGSVQSEERLAKGKFLVASRNLRDPNFFETVVLLIDYDRRGAMGLVINRPSKLTLSTVLPNIEGSQHETDTVHIGGPVAISRMLLLIRSDIQPEGAHHVFEDVYVSSSPALLQRMIDESETGERFRVYAGHAGWAPGQLDGELSRGGWHVMQADADTVFGKEPSEIWPELIRRTSVLWTSLQAPN